MKTISRTQKSRIEALISNARNVTRQDMSTTTPIPQDRAAEILRARLFGENGRRTRLYDNENGTYWIYVHGNLSYDFEA